MMSTPNIVWITMESTRADHTSLGGHRKETTPNLQRIADRATGRAFTQCFSHGVWTLASSASILTGTYPSHHGAGMTADAIPDDLPTVPERLQDAGYRTACLSPNSHLSSATGLDRGFDRFAWISKSSLLTEVGLRTLLKYIVTIRRHGGGLTFDTMKHGTGFLVNDLAKRWISSFSGDQEPFFLYAHYGNPHHPYYPPRSYRRKFTEDIERSAAEASDVSLQHHRDLHETIANGCQLSASEREALSALYDGEIAYTDALIGELFDHVNSLDLDDTVFIVTADHGELFGEHGLLAHKIVVDDAVTHVPFVAHGFDPLVEHSGEMIQHADVMRTLLEHVGADTSQLHGIDLTEETRDYSILQRGEDRCRKNLDTFSEINGEFDRDRYHEGALHAIRTADFKYQQSEDGSELYSLPDEETDVSDTRPGVATELETELNEWLRRKGTQHSSGHHESAGEFTEAMKEQLADLGYLVDS